MNRNKIICLILTLFCLLPALPAGAEAEMYLPYEAARSYLDIMNDVVAKNGYAETIDSLIGLGYARLIDFDSDGYTEFLIAANGKYDVYGYYENGLVHLHQADCWAIGGFFDLRLARKGYNTYIVTDAVAGTSLCSIGNFFGTVENKKWVTDTLIMHTPCEPEMHYGFGNWYDSYGLRNENVISESEYHTYYSAYIEIDSDAHMHYGQSETEDVRRILEATVKNEKPISVTVDGKEVSFAQPPVIVEDRTLVPIRAVVEAMNGTVDWDPDTRSITLKVESTIIRLVVGSNIASVHKHEVELDVPPQIIGDRTLLPIRFVAENFGYQVDWQADTRTVMIYK